jgi:hypothetical protein
MGGDEYRILHGGDGAGGGVMEMGKVEGAY